MLLFDIFQTQTCFFAQKSVGDAVLDSKLSDTIQCKPFKLKLLKHLHHLQ